MRFNRSVGRVGAIARVAAVLAAGVVVLAGCSTGSSADGTVTVTVPPSDETQVTAPSLSTDTSAPETESSESETSSAPAEEVRVSATPAFGSTKVGPNEPVSVSAFHGQLASVTMVGDDGTAINGEISDGTMWTASDPLDYGVTYTISGDAVDAAGATTPFSGTLSTVKPKEAKLGSAGESLNSGKNTFVPAYMQIPDGAKVGIAAPIIITFASKVADRAAAERALHVTVTDENGEPLEIEGSWGWMQDEQIQADGPKQSRVHFRPKEYWPAHAQIHVEANLKGINYGSGWGQKNIVRDFEIGDKMVVKADVDSHRLLLIVNDEIVKNYPVSYGVPKTVDDGRTTVSGIHVITDKDEEYTMCNPKYGYCGFKAQYAVRINNNGEFIHVNQQTAAAGLLGRANVSHGCVNMSLADGKDFYDRVYYGVPVDVEGTGVKMSYSDYIWDWAVSWEDWKSFSAL